MRSSGQVRSMRTDKHNKSTAKSVNFCLFLHSSGLHPLRDHHDRHCCSSAGGGCGRRSHCLCSTGSVLPLSRGPRATAGRHFPSLLWGWPTFWQIPVCCLNPSLPPEALKIFHAFFLFPWLLIKLWAPTFRQFVHFLESAQLVDPLPPFWFGKKKK